MKQRIVSVIVCLAMLFTMLPAPTFAVTTVSSQSNGSGFAGGSGTATDPYLIETKAHLNNVRNDLDAHYKMIADIVFTDTDFTASGDFYNAGQGWAPIGTDTSDAFTGTFDGAKHTITGLQINITSSQTEYAGLFGFTRNATISNIVLVNADVYVKGSHACAGGVAGYTMSTCFEGCESSGTIESSSEAGGIVGYVQGGSITNCHNSATVISSNSGGGIVGATNVAISNCSNTGDISSIDGSIVGGIVGYLYSGGRISLSYNTGNISAIENRVIQGSPTTFAGGICGESNGEIRNCFNIGTIYAEDAARYAFAGGIAGSGNVYTCYNIGNVSASASATYYVGAGGIVGDFEQATDNCYYVNTCNKGSGRGTNSAVKCTLEELCEVSTYTGFDFTNIWEFKEKNLYLYPTLIENPYWDGEFAGGTGTEEDPYLIKTKKHLNNVRNYLDAHYKMVADIVFTDEDFAEGGTFYNDGLGWQPIGTFTGTFDGNGYTISKLYISNASTADDLDVGLFSVNNGTIKNLGMVDTAISASSVNACCGSITGNNSGTITACYNTGDVTSGSYAGGIVGYNSGSISDCNNSGHISSLSTENGLGSGGIVGYNNAGTLSRCHNSGEITCRVSSETNPSTTYSGSAGGIVGCGYAGVIEECFNLGNVSTYADVITVSAIAAAGGIVGSNQSCEIAKCYNAGAVHSESSTNGRWELGWSRAGGIVGDNDSSVSNCYNVGNISSTSSSGHNYSGGVVGFNSGTLMCCYSITESTSCITAANGGTITNCYFSSETSAEGYKLFSMISQLTYKGFDFDNVWQMGDGAYPFPVLRSVKNHAEFDGILEENTTDFAGGKGIETDPFVIKTITHLNNIKNYPTSYFVIANDIAFDPESEDFPAGWQPFAFKGYLDGQGFKISNLRITVSNTLEYQWYNPGLFSLNDGIISNLTIDGSRISVSSMGDKYGGFICAENNGSIINCHSKDCTIALTNIYHYFGGIAGNNTGIIRGCTSNNNIDWQSIGGRVGGIVSNNLGTIEKCTNLTAIVNIGAYSPISGGIAAENSGTILLSQNLADISAKATADDSARSGGIVGKMTGGSISQCYNTGNISAEATQYNGYSVYVGGIVADISAGKISDCYNTGDVYGASESTSSSAYVGGIVGCNNTISDVSNCYTIGTTSGSARTSNLYVGYVCGNNASNSITNSYYLGVPENGTGSGDSTNMYGKVVTALKEMSTYNGFDFDNTWTMEGNGDYPFPELIAAPMVYEKEIQSISIESMPSKLKYIQNYELLDVAGGALKITYAYDEYDIIPLSDATLSGFDNSVIGMQSITVSYLGNTTEFQLEIVAKSLERIEVTTPPSKVTYFEGDAFSSAGMIVTAYYNDETSEPITRYAIDGYSATPGTKTIVISYGGKSTTFTVTVEAKILTGISVITPPTKVTYLEGAQLDTTGLKVQASYNNGTTTIITDYTLSGYSSTPGTKTVVVSYGGKTATFTVTVEAKTLTGISVVTPPQKLTYVEGEALDAAGLIVKASYNNGTYENVTAYSLSGFDTNKVGQQTITISYGGKTATFTVTVKSAVPDSITSNVFTVSDGWIRKISAGTTVADIVAGINEKEHIKVFSGDREVPRTALVGTGMMVKLMDGNTVKATATVVVTGDINGDGKITITDMIAVKSHVLKKSSLTGAAAQAADTSKDGGISITDFIQIKAFILGKGSITAN